MTRYLFRSVVVLDPTTSELYPGATGQVYSAADEALANPLTLFLLDGTEVLELTASAQGVLPPFRVEDETDVVWVSGTAPRLSISTLDSMLTAALEARLVSAAVEDGSLVLTFADGSELTVAGTVVGPPGGDAPPGSSQEIAQRVEEALAPYRVELDAKAQELTERLSSSTSELQLLQESLQDLEAQQAELRDDVLPTVESRIDAARTRLDNIGNEALGDGRTITEVLDDAFLRSSNAAAQADAAANSAGEASASAGAAATSASEAAAAADAAILSANGKNTSTASLTEPAGDGGAAGDTHFRYADNTYREVTGYWRWDGEDWLPMGFNHQVISSVDVGSLSVVGTATINQAVVALLVANILTANVIESEMIASDAIEARHLTVSESLWAKVLGAHLINATEINAESVAAAVGEFVTVRVDQLIAAGASINTAVIDQIFAEMFVTNRIMANQVVIGSGANMIPWRPASERLEPHTVRPSWSATVYYTGIEVEGGPFSSRTPALDLRSSDPLGMPVQPGKSYRLEVRDIEQSPGETAAADIYWRDLNGDYLTTTSGSVVTHGGTSVAEGEAPANAYYASVTISATNTFHLLAEPSFKAMDAASLIVDGGIAAVKLDVDDLAATTAFIDTLWANIVSSKTVIADQVKAGAVDGQVVTGATIRTSANATEGVKIDDDGIRSYGPSNSLVFEVEPEVGRTTMTSPDGKQRFRIVNDGLEITQITPFLTVTGYVRAYAAGGVSGSSIIDVNGDLRVGMGAGGGSLVGGRITPPVSAVIERGLEVKDTLIIGGEVIQAGDTNGWQSLTRNSGWSNTSGWNNPQYRVRNNVVYFRGRLNATSGAGTVIFNLPEAIIPEGQTSTAGDVLVFPIDAGGYHRLAVYTNTTGNQSSGFAGRFALVSKSGSVSGLSLSSISYPLG